MDKPKLLPKGRGLIALVKLVLETGLLFIVMVLLVLGKLFGDEDPNAGYKSDW